jgi:hypothetical protein
MHMGDFRCTAVRTMGTTVEHLCFPAIVSNIQGVLGTFCGKHDKLLVFDAAWKPELDHQRRCSRLTQGSLAMVTEEILLVNRRRDIW